MEETLVGDGNGGTISGPRDSLPCPRFVPVRIVREGSATVVFFFYKVRNRRISNFLRSGPTGSHVVAGNSLVQQEAFDSSTTRKNEDNSTLRSSWHEMIIDFDAPIFEKNVELIL